MIPQLLTVHVRHDRSRPVRVWIPLLPVFAVLSPLLVLAALVVVVACVVCRVGPGRALSACWHLVAGLRGLRVEVTGGGSDVLVHIR